MTTLLIQSLLWGIAMALSAAFSLWRSVGLLTSHLPTILLMSFATSVIGYLLAVLAVRIFVRRQSFQTRFAGYFFFLIIMTIGCNVLFYSLNYWHFYTQWHAPFLTRTWAWQFIYTNAGALYQYAVLGLLLYLPLGLIFVTFASYFKAKPVRWDKT